MPNGRRKPPILIAEDDADDRLLIRRALHDSAQFGAIHVVTDGVELIDYLTRRDSYRNPETSPRPGLILLDLNMPRKNGLEALQEIKSHPVLRRIPVVVLSTSTLRDDVLRSYDLGASAYVAKPIHYSDLRHTIRVLSRFWLSVAQLPPLDVP